MAWNIPGSGSGKNGGNGQGSRPPGRRGGNPLDAVVDALRGLFGGASGGGALRWIGILVVLWLAFTTITLVSEQQRGVVLRLGQYARTMQPGANFKLPWPLERVIKVNATQSQAFSDSVPVFTSDGNIVTVEFNVQYVVNDPKLYLFGTRDAKQVLEQAVLSAVREQVGRSDVDTVLNNRAAIIQPIRTRLQESLNAYRTGLTVSGLNLQNARPPDQVKDAFDEAQRATADKQTAVNQAQAYAAKVVPEARGEAARLRAAALGYKTSVVARATGDAQRFSLLLAQYKGAPEVTRKRLWLDTVQDVLAQNRKVVGAGGRELIYVPMQNAQGSGATAPPLLPPDAVAPTVNAVPYGAEPRPEREPRPTRDGATR